MVSALHRKLLRDLWNMRAQALAVAAVAMCGIAAFVSLRCAYESLLAAQHRYYMDNRFADVFTAVRRAPASVLEQVRAIPGVNEADGRVVWDAPLDVPGLADPASARLVGLPLKPGSGLNRVYLRSGRLPLARSPDEVLVSEAFSKANRLRPGDRLTAVISGRRKSLRITGIALSPEYVNEIKGTSFPDNRRFGVLWMDGWALAAALDMHEAVNSICLTLAPGASEAAVIERLDHLLERYGSLGAYGRSEQVSHNFLDSELDQAKVSATVMPAIFLAVVAFLTHNVLLRLTSLQRAQIALMKSFGYGSWAIAWHYALFALGTVMTGTVAGIGAGAWLGSYYGELYREFYHFPELSLILSGFTVAAALSIGIATALGGAALAVLRTLSLQPAEAMRPELPTRYRSGLLERLGLRNYLSLPLRMVLRQLERRPVRTLLSVAGLACAVGITVVGQFTFDALDAIIHVQFRLAQRDDLTVLLYQPRGLAAAHGLERLPGVTRVEPFRAAPVRLRFGSHVKRTVLFGDVPGAELRRLVDTNGNPVALPPEGVVLGQKLADLLAIRSGDRLAIEFMDGRRRKVELPVVRTLDESIGMFAYMQLPALARAAGEGVTIDGARLTADQERLPMLYRQLKNVPLLSSITLREATLQSFLATIAENLRVNTVILLGFACVIAYGIVYNAARIALSEHAVELASLRILGFTQAEVGRILFGEQLALTVVSLPFGCLLGYALCALFAALLNQEMFRIPLVISSRTYAVALGVVLAATAVSGWFVWQRVKRLDLIAVLKARE